MIERRDRPRLLLEAPQPVAVGGELSRQRLDRHLALQPRVTRPPDLTHAARAERGDDLVGPEARSGADHCKSANQRSPWVAVSVQVIARPTAVAPTLSPIQ